MFERFLENLGLKCLLAEQPVKLANLVLQGTTSSPLPAAVKPPCATNRRHVNSWFGATPCRRATKLTVIPGSKVSSTIRTFSDAVQRRRRWTDVMISTRSVGLIIDTVVCLTLAKWETVSGQFGGYLTPRSSPKSCYFR